MPLHGADHPSKTPLLVVDDEPLLRNVVCTLLGREGYVCGQAGSVKEALALLEKEPYRLVLCDLEMPGERGIDLVKALQPRMPEVAVVMVSGRNDMSAAAWSARRCWRASAGRPRSARG